MVVVVLSSPVFPLFLACAASHPARVHSRMSSRSNCANVEKMPKLSCPGTVVVSMLAVGARGSRSLPLRGDAHSKSHVQLAVTKHEHSLIDAIQQVHCCL